MRVVVCQYEGIDATPVLPLAAGCLVAAVRADPGLAGFELDIALARGPVADAVTELDADVLGFSLYPWNRTYSLAVAAAAKAARPEALVVCGGPSVPRLDERARQLLEEEPAVDVLVFGEGETVFRSILHAWRAGRPLDDVGGIAFRRADGEVVITAPPERELAFDAEASPFLDGTFDALLERHPGRFSMVLCETNRGCPFSCTFCDWSLTKRVVEIPVERVEAELTWVVDHGFSHLMLSDANFGIRPRDSRIIRHVAELRRTRGLPRSFYWYLSKNNHKRNLETIEVLHEAGIETWVGLAVQDFDDAVLEAVKRSRIQTGESLALRRICAERDIPTFNELILGLPGQTVTSFAQTLAEGMPSIPRHDFVLFLCRLIENAELGSPESREEHGLVTQRCRWLTSQPDFDPIVEEFQELVVGTRDLPPADWQRAHRMGFLAAALYNLRLARSVIAWVRDRADVAAYLLWLASALDDAPDGSVLAEIRRRLDAHAESTLSGGALVLAHDATHPDRRLEPDVAVAHAALARYDEFLDELGTLTSAFVGEPADEVVAWQRFTTPRPGASQVATATFQHDWVSWVAAHGSAPLIARPTTATFTPPPYAAFDDLDWFLIAHLGSATARLSTGTTSAVPAGVLTPTSG